MLDFEVGFLTEGTRGILAPSPPLPLNERGLAGAAFLRLALNSGADADFFGSSGALDILNIFHTTDFEQRGLGVRNSKQNTSTYNQLMNS